MLVATIFAYAVVAVVVASSDTAPRLSDHWAQWIHPEKLLRTAATALPTWLIALT